MKVKFWGVRGSIPSPGPKTVKYGGNTTCIEIRTRNNDLIILDSGSGIFPLSQSIISETPVNAHIFITHTHWDHIHGLPFFAPLFIADNRVNIHGGFDVVTQQGIEHALSVQLQYSYFPIREAELKAQVNYNTLTEGETVKAGSALITPTLMNHPVLNFGYRVQDAGKSVFFTGDHEPPYNIYQPDDEDFNDYENLISEKRKSILNGITDADVLIADSSYTIEEYPQKRDWGHGTFDSSIELALSANVSKLICTHHEPTRSDQDLEAVFQQVLNRHTNVQNNLDICLAKEGMEIEI